MVGKNVPNVPAEEGNTKTSSAPALYWCFTHNFENPKIETDAVKIWIVPYLEKLFSICKNFSISLEEGEKKGKRHLQGYVNLKKKLRLTQLKKVISNTTHWEKCRGSEEDNENYVLKAPLFNWSMEILIKEKERVKLGILNDIDLYDWQKEIVDIVKEEPKKRYIDWYWSCCGSIGKTEFIKHLIHYYDCALVGGAKKDIMCNILGKDGTKEIKKCYIINLPRSNEHISYDAIESIKDGLLVSNKYESSSKIIPVPHLIVFGNKEPDYKKLSLDRWRVKRLCCCVENCDNDYLD